MLPTLALGVGLVNAGLSMRAGMDAASRKRRAAEEAARRLRLSHEQTLGVARARGAAAGYEFESSNLQTHFSAMTEEFRRQEQYALTADFEEADAMESAARWGGIADVAGSLFDYGKANNWFRRPALR